MKLDSSNSKNCLVSFIDAFSRAFFNPSLCAFSTNTEIYMGYAIVYRIKTRVDCLKGSQFWSTFWNSNPNEA